MDEEIKQQIVAQLEKLPTNIREAILSVDYERKLKEICRRQHLLLDQAGVLETETTLVMIGLEPLVNYTVNLQKNMDISIIRAKEISMDVSQNIFRPIRESLRILNEGGEVPESIHKKEDKLDREQVLREIENPPKTSPNILFPETLDNTKYQKDIPQPTKSTAPSLGSVSNKMAGITITPQQIISDKIESKLPQIEKTSPRDGIDPYREPLQ